MEKICYKVSGLFFATLVVLPLLFIVVLHLAQWQAQHAAHYNLEHAALQSITIKVRDLHWEKKGRELRIGTHLFDVKKITYNDGNAVVVGLYDQTERAIEKKIAEGTGNNKTAIFSLLFLMQSFIAVHVMYYIIQAFGLIRCYSRYQNSFYLSPTLLVACPPPLLLSHRFYHF